MRMRGSVQRIQMTTLTRKRVFSAKTPSETNCSAHQPQAGKEPEPRTEAQVCVPTPGICQPPRKRVVATAPMIQRLAHSTRK
jgi:hypothetical protein